MADTRCQVECEDWVRDEWMPGQYGQPFYRRRLRLRSGGVFDFDAVSADESIVASISTSAARTSSGKKGVGKLMKLRSDMLFLLLAAPPRALLVLTERDMYEQCVAEAKSGRVPLEIEFVLATLPGDLAARLATARLISSAEVQPRSSS